MLHFLRRIRKGLIGTGATRKYLLYAVGEILLVMMGILLALQVNNWNEERKKRKNEVKLLSELHSNLKSDESQFITKLESKRDIISSREIIIRAIDNELPWNDTLKKHFIGAVSTEHFMVTKMAYNSLENWGTINISNDNLRNQIAMFYQNRVVQLEWNFSLFRDAYSGNYFDQVALNIDWDFDFENIEVFPYNYNAFIKNKDYSKREKLVKTLMKQYANTAEDCLEEMSSLIEHIENEIMITPL
jgi:hypothetical protein